MACVAPKTWTGMYNMAKAINDNTAAAGVGVTGKDFDNTMHQFLNYLYSNGGSVSVHESMIVHPLTSVTVTS